MKRDTKIYIGLSITMVLYVAACIIIGGVIVIGGIN